jgi:hypothetical protein
MFSKDWKIFPPFFQALEKLAEFFPSLGKIHAKFSRAWKILRRLFQGLDSGMCVLVIGRGFSVCCARPGSRRAPQGKSHGTQGQNRATGQGCPAGGNTAAGTRQAALVA